MLTSSRYGISIDAIGISPPGSLTTSWSKNYTGTALTSTAVIDSQATWIQLQPDDFALVIADLKDLKPVLTDTVWGSMYTVDCGLLSQATQSGKLGSLDFAFGNKIIQVPYDILIQTYQDDPFCTVGIINNTDPTSPIVLGGM